MVIPISIAEGEARRHEAYQVLRAESPIDASITTKNARPPLEANTPLARVSHERLLVGERNHRFHFIETSTVDFMEVNGNYVTIHVGEERFLTRATLKHLSAQLSASDFVRIDRSCLVNLRRVEYVERLEGGEFAFTLRSGRRVVSSRERAGGILKLLRSAIR